MCSLVSVSMLNVCVWWSSGNGVSVYKTVKQGLVLPALEQLSATGGFISVTINALFL